MDNSVLVVFVLFSGAGLHTGFYGRILAGLECTQGQYPVTMSVLNLLTNLVNVSNTETNELDKIFPILINNRDVFI